jgi:acetolactate synthase-1/2/3 large subunit
VWPCGRTSELTQLAEALGVPVMTSVMGKGAIATDHPLLLGSQALQSAVQEYIDRCEGVIARTA